MPHSPHHIIRLLRNPTTIWLSNGVIFGELHRLKHNQYCLIKANPSYFKPKYYLVSRSKYLEKIDQKYSIILFDWHRILYFYEPYKYIKYLNGHKILMEGIYSEVSKNRITRRERLYVIDYE